MSSYPKIITAVVCFLMYTSTWVFGTDTPILKPRFDERVELLGIVYRLAGAPEYQSVALKSYDDDINRHFAKFKIHPAVLAAKVSRNAAGIAYNAVVDYAVHIFFKDGHVVFPDEDSEITLELLEPRWKKKTAESFAKLLDDVSVEPVLLNFTTGN